MLVCFSCSGLIRLVSILWVKVFWLFLLSWVRVFFSSSCVLGWLNVVMLVSSRCVQWCGWWVVNSVVRVELQDRLMGINGGRLSCLVKVVIRLVRFFRFSFVVSCRLLFWFGRLSRIIGCLVSSLLILLVNEWKFWKVLFSRSIGGYGLLVWVVKVWYCSCQLLRRRIFGLLFSDCVLQLVWQCMVRFCSVCVVIVVLLSGCQWVVVVRFVLKVNRGSNFVYLFFGWCLCLGVIVLCIGLGVVGLLCYCWGLWNVLFIDWLLWLGVLGLVCYNCVFF